MSEDDLRLFEQIATVPQRGLKKAVYSYLKSKYEVVVNTKDYVYAVGNIPIALVAHLDTVFTKTASDIYYDRKKNVMWSPEGLGADDRAGVFSICQIIKSGFLPHVIFTTDEEKGGLGAYELAKIECPFRDLRYMIELDRRGEDDCVFYDHYDPQFIDYIESFGFKEAWGTFSDISYLAPDWGVAAVNLSIGYKNEHTTSEILNVTWMYKTIERVKEMLTAQDIPAFEFKENPYTAAWLNAYYGGGSWNVSAKNGAKSLPTSGLGQTVCHKCRLICDVADTYPVEIGPGEFKDYCMNCISHKDIEWCNYCGSPYIADAGQPVKVCRACEETYAC
jgi:hypothetical protein